jgi:hypothetical protein
VCSVYLKWLTIRMDAIDFGGGPVTRARSADWNAATDSSRASVMVPIVEPESSGTIACSGKDDCKPQ